MTADIEAARRVARAFLDTPEFHDAISRGSDLRRGSLKHNAVRGWALPRRGGGALEYKDAEVRRLIKMARRGDADADVVLCDIASDMLKGKGRPLANYIAEVLMKLAGKARHRPGSDPNALMIRNRIIYDAVLGVMEYGFKARRTTTAKPSRDPQKECGCSIVVEELARVGCHMTESNVVEIYRQGRLKTGALKRRNKN